MKKSVLTLCFHALILGLFAQTSTGDCEGAIVLCGDVYTEDSAPPGTGNVYEYTGACNNNLETMSLWYTFTVQQDGNLSFTLTPATAADDYDWGLFDITTGGCQGISATNGTSPEVSCNSWGSLNVPNGATGISTAQGGTGNSNGPGDLNGPPFNADLPVTAGQTFALVVMNWSQSTDGYTIDFGGSTATIYDDINPELVSVSTGCNNQSFGIVFSENIVLTSVENLDFQITGPGGSFNFTDVAAVDPTSELDDAFILTLDEPITEPGSYTLTVTNSAGSIEDPCGNLALDASFVVELFAPMSMDVSTSTACNGEDGSLVINTISGGEAPYAFYLNDQAQSDLNADNLNPGAYTVEIVDNNGCSISGNYDVPDNPIALFIPEQDTLSCARTTVDITGVELNPEQTVEYTWYYQEDGNYSPTGSTSPATGVSVSGWYLLEAVNTENGCVARDSIFIATEEVETFDLTKMRFPNIVTANKDGKNDDWAPFLSNNQNLNLSSVFETYNLKIYNRWGNIIFDTEKESGRRWTIAEEESGTYYYVFTYRITCGGVQEGKLEGSVMLIRE